MRAPNGQGCTISWHRELSLTLAADIVWRCVPELRQAHKERKSILFMLEAREEQYMKQHIPGDTSLAEKFRLFLNEAFERKRLPYRLDGGLGEVRGHFYGFRVIEA